MRFDRRQDTARVGCASTGPVVTLSGRQRSGRPIGTRHRNEGELVAEVPLWLRVMMAPCSRRSGVAIIRHALYRPRAPLLRLEARIPRAFGISGANA
jgi:hypothetical protein